MKSIKLFIFACISYLLLVDAQVCGEYETTCTNYIYFSYKQKYSVLVSNHTVVRLEYKNTIYDRTDCNDGDIGFVTTTNYELSINDTNHDYSSIVQHKAIIDSYYILTNEKSRLNTFSLECTPSLQKGVNTNIDGYSCSVSALYNTFLVLRNPNEIDTINIKFTADSMTIGGVNGVTTQKTIGRTGIDSCPHCAATTYYPEGDINDKITVFCDYPEVTYASIICQEIGDGTAKWIKKHENCDVVSPYLDLKTGYTTIRFPLYISGIQLYDYTPAINDIILNQFIRSFSKYIPSLDYLRFDLLSGLNETNISNSIVLTIRTYVPQDLDSLFIDEFINYVDQGYFEFALRKKNDVLMDSQYKVNRNEFETRKEVQSSNMNIGVIITITILAVIAVIFLVVFGYLFFTNQIPCCLFKHNNKNIQKLNSTSVVKDEIRNEPVQKVGRHHHGRHHNNQRPSISSSTQDNTIDTNIVDSIYINTSNSPIENNSITEHTTQKTDTINNNNINVEPTSISIHEPVDEPIKEVADESIKEVADESIKEPIQEPIQEPISNNSNSSNSIVPNNNSQSVSINDSSINISINP